MTERIELESLFESSEYCEAFNFFASHSKDIFKNKGESPTFYIRTYGCQMNEHDSEMMRWIFNMMGYVESNEEEGSDVILYNTCLIRENAELKIFGKIGALKGLKKRYPNTTVIVCGCMMQNDIIREKIIEKYKQVDIIFGTNNIHSLPLLLYNHLLNKDFISDIIDNKNLLIEGIGAVNENNFKSYVNITYGCNNFCTYCVVPYTRGREVSRLPKDILKEVRLLAQNGTRELTLLGQNVNSYGNTFEKEYRFPDLLKDINSIEGIERIRFMTSHPKDISDELIECYGKLKRLSPFLHLPVQSGSNKILKAMNRHYDREKYLRTIEKLKVVSPDIALSTDIIVGFPGESRDDFLDTISLIKEVEYDSSFSFIFSRRPGTKAYLMDGQIDEVIKKERLQELNNVLNDISYKKNLKYLGNEEEVLIEEISKQNSNMLTGRTLTNKLVHFEGDKSMIGKFAMIKINEAKSFSLEGELIRTVDK